MTVKQFVEMLMKQWINVYIYRGSFKDFEKMTTIEKLLEDYGDRVVSRFDPNISVDLILESEEKS